MSEAEKAINDDPTVKALKEQLENDNGTVFRYHNHENTYLNHIFWQIKDKSDLPADEINTLCEFIKSPCPLSTCLTMR